MWRAFLLQVIAEEAKAWWFGPLTKAGQWQRNVINFWLNRAIFALHG